MRATNTSLRPGTGATRSTPTSSQPEEARAAMRHCWRHLVRAGLDPGPEPREAPEKPNWVHRTQVGREGGKKGEREEGGEGRRGEGDQEGGTRLRDSVQDSRAHVGSASCFIACVQPMRRGPTHPPFLRVDRGGAPLASASSRDCMVRCRSAARCWYACSARYSSPPSIASIKSTPSACKNTC